MKQNIKKLSRLLKPPGMDPRHGLKKTYRNIFFGLKKILSGELRLDYIYGKTGYHQIYPYEGRIPDRFRHEFSIAAIVRNEGRHLQEWIEFHRIGGCTKFYIYDNSSTDNTRDILKYYETKGLVEWVDWPHMNPWLHTQQLAYCHAIYKSRGKTRWLAFIDADEFLFSPEDRGLEKVLAGYTDLPALIVYWEMFGTSGHRTRPEGLLTENFTKKLDISHPGNTYHPLAKSIVQPLRVRAVSNVHCFQTEVWPIIGYDENRIPVSTVSDIHPQKTIQLNHYYTKSKQDWDERMSRTWAGSGYRIMDQDSPKLASYKSVYDDIHRYETEDTACHYMLPELRRQLKENLI
ncbi:MAG: glycosyltransferase family 92 protein [Desulfobacterales bacterium]|nr:glycosyltransferase family 92 protein [Desulfobacterales bacterium]